MKGLVNHRPFHLSRAGRICGSGPVFTDSPGRARGIFFDLDLPGLCRRDILPAFKNAYITSNDKGRAVHKLIWHLTTGQFYIFST